MAELAHSKSQAVTSSSFSAVDLWMLLLVSIWGANFVALKFAVSDMGALGFGALRFTLGTLVMLGLWRAFGGTEGIARRDWPAVIALGIVGNTGYQFFFISAIKYSTASNTSLIVATAPIWVALFGGLLKLDRLSWRGWLGILLSFAGLYLIINNSFSANTLTLGSQTLFGDLLMLGGALSWAVYTLLSKPLLARYSSLTYTTWSMAAGAPLILLLGVPDLLQTNFAAVAPSVWVIMFFSAMLAISIGYVIWNNGVHVLGQSRTAVYSNVIPVVAFALSVVLLGEPVTAAKVVGAAVVLVGVTITRRG
jgi:drug/metabolite transporter (DMT)-like permease